MEFDLKSARQWAHSLMCEKLEPGMKVLDATMGNGHDTLFLCECVGDAGHVYAFDIQMQAIENTRVLLSRAGMLHRTTLIHAGHERMDAFIMESLDAVLFNLGWLPGGNKKITTHKNTTILALDAAIQLLKLRGLLTVCVYPGHQEGDNEREAVLEWAKGLSKEQFQSRLTMYLNQSASTPLMIVVQRLK